MYPEQTLSEQLDRIAELSGSETAVVDDSDGCRLSYGELRDAVINVASALSAAGVGPRDVVTVQLPNWWESVVVFHAVVRLGAVVNPVVPIYRGRELHFILGEAQPKVIITPHVFRGFDYQAMLDELLSDQSEAPVRVVVRGDDDSLSSGETLAFEDLVSPGVWMDETGSPSEPVLLLYTSGTTADPKGVLHSHQTLSYEVQSFVDLFDLEAADTLFVPSPVTHITGLLYGVVLPLFTGCKAVLLDVWDPSVAGEMVEREECRFLMGATPFLQGLVQQYTDSPASGSHCALRVFVCGGADVPPALVRQASEVLGCHVARVYGSSEFPTLSCGGPLDDMEVRAETDGMPVGPISYRLENLVDGVGELVVDGPELFLGYSDPKLNDSAFTPDGHFRTGDLATIGSSGAVTIQGREKDIIVRGGENISAREVEDLLHLHEAVEVAAVVAMPDPVLVERSCAFIVSRREPSPTLEELTDFLVGKKLAKQKLPERLEIVTSMPTTASGKVQKFLLREQVRELLAADS